jgi:hypothetical protein
MNAHSFGSDPIPQPANRFHRRSRAFSLLPLLLAVVLLAGTGGPADAAEVVVVVNAVNPVSSLSLDDISKLFLKKTSKWPDGGKVMPVDLIDTSALRESFSKQIHGRGAAAIKAYWQKMIFSGQDVPPPEKATIGEALSYVRSNPGAIGYAPAGADLGPGLKILKVTP